MSDSRETGPRKGGTFVRGPRTPEPTIPEPPPRGVARPSYTPAGPPGVKLSLPGSSVSMSGAAHSGVPPRPHVPAAAASGRHDAELMPGVGNTVYEFRGDAAAASNPRQQRASANTAETFYSEASFTADHNERRDTNLRGSRMTWVIVSLVVVVAGGLAVGMSAFAPAAGELAPARSPSPTVASPGDASAPANPGAATSPGAATPQGAATEPGATTPTGTATSPTQPAAGPTDGGQAANPAATPPKGTEKPADSASSKKSDTAPSKPKQKPSKSKPKPKKPSKPSAGIKPKKPPRKDLDDLPPPPGGA